MTLDEFYTKLAGIGRTWRLINGNRIRSIKNNDCPMAAVGNESGEETFPSHAFTQPARLIGLPIEDAKRVAFAADGSLDHLQIRQRLLEACNLIVPEITPVEQVNACELECAT